MNLTKAFHFINDRLFDGFLDMPYMEYISDEYCDLFSMVGFCIPKNIQGDWFYYVGIAQRLTENEKFNTLVHELIHVYLIETESYSWHGKPFKKWCRKAINEFYGEFKYV